MPVAIVILILMAIVGLSSAPAQAGTKIPGVAPQKKWKGCAPPATMKPAPKFHCGQELVNTDSGDPPRKVKVDHLEAAPVKGGFWLWTYYMTDGTFAHADSLRE